MQNDFIHIPSQRLYLSFPNLNPRPNHGRGQREREPRQASTRTGLSGAGSRGGVAGQKKRGARTLNSEPLHPHSLQDEGPPRPARDHQDIEAHQRRRRGSRRTRARPARTSQCQPGFSTTATEKNNARLVDDGRAQKLSHEDVEELKEKGVTGEALVEKILENSATFEAKTEFSQEKYKRKKQKKHCTALVLCRPCAQTICEAYFQKSLARICGLRVDSLGMLLCSANVGAHSKVLVLEESSGLILASVLERLGGHGEACALSLSSGKSKNAKPPMDIVRFMNFDSGITRHSTYASLADLLKAKDRQREETTQDTAMAEAAPIETSGDGSDKAKANGTEAGAGAGAGKKDEGAEGKTEGEPSGKDVAMASPKGDTAAEP